MSVNACSGRSSDMDSVSELEDFLDSKFRPLINDKEDAIPPSILGDLELLHSELCDVYEQIDKEVAELENRVRALEEEVEQLKEEQE